MNDLPRRTGVTNLSDAELLIFDFLWWIHVPRHFLYADMYSIHMNVTYTHSLTNQQTDETLQNLVDQKHIQNREGSPDSFTLTALGGSLWESERCPNWETYISDQGSRNGKRFSTVALNETIGRLHIATMFAAGLIVPTNQIKCRTIYNHWLTPWKRVPTAKLLRVPVRGQEPFHLTDWDVYESGRVWWRSIGELNSLNPNAV